MYACVRHQTDSIISIKPFAKCNRSERNCSRNSACGQHIADHIFTTRSSDRGETNDGGRNDEDDDDGDAEHA